jgi:CRP-like cAMP-binding protein
MRENEWESLLGRVGLFEGLSDKSLAKIAREMKESRFAAGDVVIEQGSGGGEGLMYIVIEGTADVSVHGTVIGRYGPGDHFGEMSLLDGGPRSATVTATSDLRLGGLASWSLRPLLREEPEIAIHIIQVLAGWVRAKNAQLTG